MNTVINTINDLLSTMVITKARMIITKLIIKVMKEKAWAKKVIIKKDKERLKSNKKINKLGIMWHIGNNADG